MKRKLFILCLTCLITISFIGCNDTTAVDTTTNTTAATTSLTTENTTTENTTTVTTSATTTTVTTMATTTVVVDYTLTFNSNQGTACSPIVGNVGVGITLPIPTRTGYFFAGWFTDALFTTPFQDDVMPSVDLMLYAKWMTSAEVTAFLTSLNESTQLSFDMETTVNIDGAEESHSLVEYHRNGDSIKIITLDDSPMYTSGYTIYIVKSDDTYMSFRKQDCEDCTACWTRSEESIFDITNNQSYLLSRFSQAA